MAIAERLGHALSRPAGLGLAGAIRGIAAVRPAAKPLHPRGVVEHARLVRTGGAPSTGASWLDEAGDDVVLVRRSRAIGLPSWLPDIHGLAVRVPDGAGGYGDLLLATTGSAPLLRHLLTFGRSVPGRWLTTLLPYRTAGGPRLVAARAVDGNRYELAHAGLIGGWHRFADLTVAHGVGQRPRDALVSFDPVRNTLPGVANYGWVTRLRAPSYTVARLSRRDRRDVPATSPAARQPSRTQG